MPRHYFHIRNGLELIGRHSLNWNCVRNHLSLSLFDPRTGMAYMPDKLHEFDGKRILVVEDEYLIAEELRMQLVEHGATVLGPVASVNDALALIKSGAIDAAILDVNLDAETTFPVAFVLEQQDVPFVFVTGAVPEGVPERYFKYVLGKSSTLQAIGQGLFGLSRH